MSDYSSEKKNRVALFVSVAANIFLFAFLLGRFSSHEMPPHQFGPMGMNPPNMQQGGMPGAGIPPFFGPGDLFGPNEMHANEASMHENFDKMEVLRNALAVQLQAGPVSKEEVLKHFADLDQVVDAVKKEAQGRAADKISAMSEEDRKHFAQMLQNRSFHPPESDPEGNGHR